MYSIAISPCPNDTFAFFDYLSNDKDLQTVYLDIQDLNRGAIAGRYDIVKASFAAYPLFEKHYELLPSGSALGFGVGPVLISRDEFVNSLQNQTIGIPGENTTARLLLDFYRKSSAQFANAVYKYITFSEILPALKQGTINFGVLIHEGRFVYKREGLHLYADLGEFWEQQTNYPIPLGGIFIRRSLPDDVKKSIAASIKKSIERAFAVYNSDKEQFARTYLPFIRSHSQELSEDVLLDHIFTYVNDDTIELSTSAKAAIDFFLELAKGTENEIRSSEI